MKISIYSLLIGLFMLPVILAQAQQISGNVSDDKGPLVGVSVYEKNLTTNGTSTDNNGHFALTLKQEKVLVFKLVGYLTKEVSIAPNQKTINVTMAEDTKGLEEIVVLGYGTQKKLTNTGSVSSITSKDLKQNPTTNLQNSLQGRLPGFFAVQRSGQPGLDASQFFIRGVSGERSRECGGGSAGRRRGRLCRVEALPE